MGVIATPHTFVPATKIEAAEVNANFNEHETKFNSFAVLTDTPKTISVVVTFAVAPDLEDGLLVSGGGADIVGALSVDGESSFTDTLTVSSGGVEVTGNSVFTGTVQVTSTTSMGGKLTVTAGGLETTGNVSHHDGNFTVGTSVATISLTAGTNANLVGDTASITLTSGGLLAQIGNAAGFSLYFGPSFGVEIADNYIRPRTNGEMQLGRSDRQWAELFTNILHVSSEADPGSASSVWIEGDELHWRDTGNTHYKFVGTAV